MDEQPRVRHQPLVLLLTPLLLAALLPAAAAPAAPAPADGAGLRAGQPAVRQVPARADTLEEAVTGPEELRRRLRSILREPSLTRAHVGLVVQVAETGRILFERAPHRRFVPASNTKIVTGAVALHQLGADHRWETRLVATGPIRDGTLRGDLWVVGGGDPLLGREDLGALADRLRQAGVRRVSGDLVGDGRRYPAPQWGSGWMWTDVYTGWGAGISALRLDPGRIRASLLPGPAMGDSARLVLRAGGPLPTIRNRARTGPPGSDVRLDFVPDPRFEPPALEGWIPADADSVDLYLAPDHPTTHVVEALADSLAGEDVRIAGEVRRARRGEEPSGVAWTDTLRSDSLGAVLPELLKPSDNQIAEMLVRALGVEEDDRGTAEAGLGVVEDQLQEWGIEAGAIDLNDGSGMSRYNQVTPAAMTRLLRRLWQLPDYGLFRDALPVAADDGTLEGRLLGTPAANNLLGKTGSLSSVRALSGYVRAGDGTTLVYSLLLNGYDGSGDVAIAMEDLMVEQLSLYRRPVTPGWPGERPPEEDDGGDGS